MNMKVLSGLNLAAFILIISSCQDPVKNIPTVVPSGDESIMENSASGKEQDMTVKFYDQKTLEYWKERYLKCRLNAPVKFHNNEIPHRN